MSGKGSYCQTIYRDAMVLRPLAGIDLLFLCAFVLLAAAAVGYRFGDAGKPTRLAAVLGWTLAVLFWTYQSWAYLAESRTFLGLVGTVTVVVATYVTTLVARDRSPGGDLTVAYAVMGLLFAGFQFVAPVYRLVLGLVATHTAWGLSLAGFAPIVGYGPQGFANVIYFEGRPTTHAIRIISACSGISAMALFAGLIAATRETVGRRVVSAVAVVALVYVLNVIRAMFVAGALAGQWFAFLAGPAGSLFGVTDPALASYYVAEYAIAQVLVVLVLLGVYLRVSARLPALQTLVDGLFEAARTDWERLPQT